MRDNRTLSSVQNVRIILLWIYLHLTSDLIFLWYFFFSSMQLKTMMSNKVLVTNYTARHGPEFAKFLFKIQMIIFMCKTKPGSENRSRQCLAWCRLDHPTQLQTFLNNFRNHKRKVQSGVIHQVSVCMRLAISVSICTWDQAGPPTETNSDNKPCQKCMI